MSRNGSSGRGIRSPSHAPTTIRAAGARCPQNARTSALVPMPASPATKTRRAGAVLRFRVRLLERRDRLVSLEQIGGGPL
jgi:hypothetical protein